MHRHRTATLHSTKKRLDQVRSEINVTPLVDVCLVLLIIFMVVTDKLTRGKDVPLPKTKHHVEIKDTGDQLIVSLSKDGSHVQLWWDREAVKDIPELRKHLDEELHRKPRPMFVKGDADLTYGDVYPVLVEINKAGSPQVQLSTQELKENK